MVETKRCLFSVGVGVIALSILLVVINPFNIDFKLSIPSNFTITGLFTGNRTSNETQPLMESLESETTSTTSVDTTTTSSTTVLTTTSPKETTTTSPQTTTSTTTTVPSANHVVFSEVFYDTPGEESEEEWIELYNPTLNNIDVSGLKITDNSNEYVIPNGIIISHVDYLVIAKNKTAFENLYSNSPDITGLNLNLNNDGDVLRLKNGSEEIDMVAWEHYVSGWDLKADKDESIQRDPPERDTDTSDDWLSHTNPDPEPGGLITTTTIPVTTTTTTVPTTTTTTTTTPATTTIPAGPYIGEIMYNPPVELEEWVKIISATQVNMTSWNLTDAANHVYKFPLNFILYGAVKVHTNTGVDNSTDLYWNQSQAIWNNDHDNATLIDNQGTIIDQESY